MRKRKILNEECNQILKSIDILQRVENKYFKIFGYDAFDRECLNILQKIIVSRSELEAAYYKKLKQWKQTKNILYFVVSIYQTKYKLLLDFLLI